MPNMTKEEHALLVELVAKAENDMINTLGIPKEVILESTAKGSNDWYKKYLEHKIEKPPIFIKTPDLPLTDLPLVAGETFLFNEDKLKLKKKKLEPDEFLPTTWDGNYGSMPSKGSFPAINSYPASPSYSEYYGVWEPIIKEKIAELADKMQEEQNKIMPNLLDEMNVTTLKVIKPHDPKVKSQTLSEFMTMIEDDIVIDGGKEIQPSFTLTASPAAMKYYKEKVELKDTGDTLMSTSTEGNSSYTEEEITNAFALAPSILRILEKVGAHNPSIDIFTDGSGEIKLYSGWESAKNVDMIVELAKSLVDGYAEKGDGTDTVLYRISFAGGLVEAAKVQKTNLQKEKIKQLAQNLDMIKEGVDNLSKPSKLSELDSKYLLVTSNELTIEVLTKTFNSAVDAYLNSPNIIKVHPKSYNKVAEVIKEYFMKEINTSYFPSKDIYFKEAKLLPHMSMPYNNIDFYYKDTLLSRLTIIPA